MSEDHTNLGERVANALARAKAEKDPYSQSIAMSLAQVAATIDAPADVRRGVFGAYMRLVLDDYVLAQSEFGHELQSIGEDFFHDQGRATREGSR